MKSKRAPIEKLYLDDLGRLQERIERTKDKEWNKDGGETYALRLTLIGIAAGQYLVDHSIEGYRESLRKSAKLRLSMVKKYDAGESIDISVVSLNIYIELFHALAAADFETAYEFARLIGKDSPRSDRSIVHHSDCVMAYAIKYLMLEDTENFNLWHSRLEARTQKKGDKSYQGLAKAMKGIGEKDIKMTEEGLMAFSKVFHRIAKQFGRDMCLDGIGLANLARHQGLKIQIDTEWIPAELLVDCP